MTTVREWLAGLGLERYADVFDAADIDWEVLPEIADADLRELGVTLGHRKRLLKAIQKISAQSVTEAAEKPTSTSEAVGAERRQLTVMFSDLVGSTALSRRLDPEDLRDLMGRYQDAVASVVAARGGHVANYVGDGVVVYFGWPRADEDQSAQAVRAGLAVIEAVQRLIDPDEKRLAARVGIATGQVVVGELVSQMTRQTDAISGDTPNLAARLQGIAGAGQVVIEATTKRLVGGAFELTNLGSHDLKGIGEAVEVWRVESERIVESRFEAAHGGALTGLVGRANELGLLLDRWETVTDGEGQVVVLSGEPGIGKSRLSQALHDSIGEHIRVRHQCSPYHTNSTLYPAIQQLQHAAGFTREDPDDVKLDKLETLLAKGSDDPAKDAPLIAGLLSLAGEERYGALDLTPQQIKQSTLDVLIAQLLHLSRRQPVLFLCEDAHWIDPTSLELLEQSAPRIRQSRILMLVTHRLGWHSPFGRHAHVTSLQLNRLGRNDAAEIVRALIGARAPDDVINPIVERTDGVPLFLEELTHSMIEVGLDAKSNEIPATLQALLSARLDRLGSVAKEVAQSGAIIGRDFRQDLVTAVADMPTREVDAALERLVQSELVFRTGSPPDTTYSFKHALIQDAARQSLLKSKRQQLHAKVGQTIIAQSSTIANTEPELLAFHFTEAGLLDEAIEYWQRAGERAVQRSANLEAIDHINTALELLATMPRDRSRAERELRLLTLRSPAQMVTKGRASDDLAATLERARHVAKDIASPEYLVPATIGLWLLNMTRGAFDKAVELTQELFTLARKGEDDGLLLQAYHAAWTTSFFTGDFENVERHVLSATELYDPKRHGDHRFIYLGHDPMICAQSLRSIAVWMLGYDDQALNLAGAAIDAAESLDHPPTLVHALTQAGNLHVLRQDPDTAAALAERLSSISSELNMAPGIVQADCVAGWAQTYDGEIETGLARLQRGIDKWKSTGALIHMPIRLSMLADGFNMLGNFSEARKLNSEAIRMAETTGENWYSSVLYWQRGNLFLSDAQDHETAEVAFEKSLAIAREQSAKLMELRAGTSLARLWHAQARTRQASDLLTPIIAFFTEGCDAPELAKAKALLEELS